MSCRTALREVIIGNRAEAGTSETRAKRDLTVTRSTSPMSTCAISCLTDVLNVVQICTILLRQIHR